MSTLHSNRENIIITNDNVAYNNINRSRGGGEEKEAGDDRGARGSEDEEEGYDYIINMPHLKHLARLKTAHSGNNTPPHVHKQKVALATAGEEEPEKLVYERIRQTDPDL